MSPTPTYPPAPTATAPANPAPVVQQPGANTGMSVSREAQNQEQKAERLRGGCIPLPVSLRDLLNNSDAEQVPRTAVAAGSSPSHAAAKRVWSYTHSPLLYDP
ncbi:hypothetical protein EV121DRAFT_276125 [Schizophyllum commune]